VAKTATCQKYQIITDTTGAVNCGFMGMACGAKPKRESTPDGIIFDAEVVWSGFDQGD
jgi:hypothetical protein